MVCSRCAMTMVVRFWHRCSIASCTSFSDSGIQRGGRFIEQDDRRVLHQRAGNGDALALAAGELRAVLADRRIVAAREAHDEIVSAGGLCRCDDFGVGRARFAEGDVLANGVAEQIDVLTDIGGLAVAANGARCPR